MGATDFDVQINAANGEPVTESNPLPIKQTARNVAQAIAQSVAAGQSHSINGDVRSHLKKTAYVRADQKGNAGLEFLLDDGVTWLPLLPIYRSLIDDNFTGANNAPLSTLDWAVVRSGVYTDATSKAYINNNKARVVVQTGAGNGATAIVNKNALYLTVEHTVEIVVNETGLGGAAALMINAGISPSIPADGTSPDSVTNKQRFIQVFNSSVMVLGTTYTFGAGPLTGASAKANAIYRFVFTATSFKCYRDGVLIHEATVNLSQPQYYFWYESWAKPSLTWTTDLDYLTVQIKTLSAEVKPFEPWIYTFDDAIAGQVKLTFKNNDNTVTNVDMYLGGQ